MMPAEWEVAGPSTPSPPVARGGQWERVGAPGYDTASEAITSAMKTRGGQVRYVSPDTVLELSPPFEKEPWSDPAGRSLRKSLDAGDKITEIPSFDLSVKDGVGTVTGQDGRHRALAAKEAGVDLIPVLFKTTGRRERDEPITELVGLPSGALAKEGNRVPFDFATVGTPKAQQPRKPPTHGMGAADYERSKEILGGIGSGLFDELVGLNNLFVKILPMPGSIRSAQEKYSEERESKIKEERAARGETGLDVPRLVGNVLSPLNYLPGAAVERAVPVVNALGRVAQGALGGGTAALLDPSTKSDNYWAEKAGEVSKGMLAGAAGGVVGETLGAAVKPTFNAAKTLLFNEGVRLTPGQAAGGFARSTEDKATSIPITGDAIAYGRRTGIRDFNIAAYNRALKPIGKKYEDTEVGYEGLKKGRQKLSDAYTDALEGVTWRFTPKFDADLSSLRTLVKEMPPDQVAQFDNVLKNRVLGRMPTGTMDGQTFKQVESELTNAASGYHSSKDWKERQFGDALDELNAIMRRTLSETNPDKAPALKKANEAWAAFAKVRKAVTNRARSDGIFTPGDLLGALKSSDRSPGKDLFSQGDAVMQDLARAGNEVLGNAYPDSGTVGRALLAGGAIEGSRLAEHPEILLGLGAAGAPYLPGSLSAFRYYATSAPWPGPRQSVANALRGIGQSSGAGAGLLATQTGQ